ncbi:MAG: PAS domain S-box protein [Deltaproteobacteria bacterium]|nr:MAG: PAS domain S-box protein [Deltaproteobacteria bacterium]
MPGTLFQGGFVLAVLTGYLLLLFGIGYLGERKFDAIRARGLDRYVYVFAAGVYCTSWTFYGCIGNAAQNGPSFLALFIGPSVFALTWWTVLRKLVRFCRAHNVTSVPDLLSVRYGGTPWLGSLATLFLVLGSVPYISLQLRAVGLTYDAISGGGGLAASIDPMLVVALFLGAFALFFGGRYLDFTRPQGGVLTAVATESVVKLVILMAAGVFVCYGLFDGIGDVYSRFRSHPEWGKLTGLSGAPGNGYARWTAYFVIAVIDVLLLPRQFHVLVVQNGDESHIKTAMWMFPLYLLLINLFVIPIAFGGLLLGLPAAAGDNFILAIPMLSGQKGLSLLIFIGGFSAATAMVLVSSVALGKMVANNLVIPGILRARRGFHAYGYLLAATRASILAVIGLGYVYARWMSGNAALMEIGVISFVAVAQFGPPVFGGMYWKGGTAGGAVLGLCAGFTAWFYTLILPAAAKAGFLDPSFVANGPFGIALLRPADLLSAGIGDPVGNAVFWSLFLNVLGYAAGSHLFAAAGAAVPEGPPGVAEVPVPGAPPGRGAHYPSLEDIEAVMTRYAGHEKEKEVGEVVREIREIKSRGQTREAVIRQMELPARLERILTGSIGVLSARSVLRDMLPLTLADARTLVESFREMEKDLASTREAVSHKEEQIRARERLLASVVHSIDDGIVAFDAGGRITAVNEGGCRLFGRPERAMIGEGFQLLIRDTPYREKQRIIARSTYRHGRWRGEVDFVRGDGTQTAGLVSTARINDERGRAAGFVASFKDLSEIKAMQNKMIQSEKLASLGQMAAGVAHEIRTPLGSIKMSTRLLREEAAGSEASEMLGTIRDAVASMEVIVNELLDYTRDIALQLDDYDLVSIARSSVFGLEDEWRRRGVSVGVESSEGPVSAIVDGVRIKQVLTNIVKNAVEAAPDLRGRVTVRLAGGNGAVRITVEDNGPGMTAEELGNVFQPFYTSKAQGTGLGMSIVKRLVELHGGEVRIDSDAGRGTTVSVDLPRTPFAGTGRAQ